MRLLRLQDARFIPVYTGNTRQCRIYLIMLSVYPCVYREHKRMDARTNSWVGLSLCIQGTLNASGNGKGFKRFIPVYTGNTPRIFNQNRGIPVYPCVYREHLHGELVIFRSRGLSLCIQGTHHAL